MDFSGTHVEAGRVLEWIDRAGYACAVGWSASYCVTAYVGNIHYDRNIHRGDLVEVDARVILTGTSSIHVLVSVHARSLTEAESTRAMHCILVFVTVDENGRPQRVKSWTPLTPDDVSRQRLALERVPVRTRIKEAMLTEAYTENGTGPRSVLRFVAGSATSNWAGNAHGGTVMRWINDAAAATSLQVSPKGTRAKYSGGIHFHHPIHTGNLVEVDARALLIVDDEIHLSIRVRSAPANRPQDLILTTRCMMIFTAESDPSTIKAIDLRTAEDRRLAQHARDIIQMRQELTSISDHLIHNRSV